MGHKSDEKWANHAVCVPFPAQGHINPMLYLAQILHSRGFHITFVNTEHNYHRLLKSSHADGSSGSPSFNFVSLPNGLPVKEDADAPRDIMDVIYDIMNNRLALPLKELLYKLKDESPATCLIVDVAMGFSIAVAEELGLMAVSLETASPCSFRGYLHYRWLINKGIIPLKDHACLENGYLETIIDSIPSMKGIRLKDMPTFLRTTDPEDMMLNAVMSNAQTALRSTAIIINTFNALDQEILDELSLTSRGIYPIGPLHLLAARVEDRTPVRPCLREPEPECLEWLDSQEPDSVLYVNFGTMTVLSTHQLLEFAWGIANSGHKFLWIIRSDLVIDDDHEESNALPDDYLKKIKGRGFIGSWCDQESVLKHFATKGFLTHCGWNSTVEGISCGVALLCWPYAADQVTNCWYCCQKLGMGMELSGDVRRDEVEKMVRELMEGEKGKEMKRTAMGLKMLAEEAVMGPNGSSHVNLEKVISLISI